MSGNIISAISPDFLEECKMAMYILERMKKSVIKPKVLGRRLWQELGQIWRLHQKSMT